MGRRLALLAAREEIFGRIQVVERWLTASMGR